MDLLICIQICKRILIGEYLGTKPVPYNRIRSRIEIFCGHLTKSHTYIGTSRVSIGIKMVEPRRQHSGPKRQALLIVVLLTLEIFDIL